MDFPNDTDPYILLGMALRVEEVVADRSAIISTDVAQMLAETVFKRELGLTDVDFATPLAENHIHQIFQLTVEQSPNTEVNPVGVGYQGLSPEVWASPTHGLRTAVHANRVGRKRARWSKARPDQSIPDVGHPRISNPRGR